MIWRGYEDDFTDDEVSHVLHMGGASFCEHPWLIGKKLKWQLQEELDEALAKKRPVGFAPWPEDES